MRKPPRVGVAVVAYNSEAVIGQLLDSLPDAAAGIITDVVVVDNNSSDNTAALVENRTDCRLLRSANVGYGAAVNRARDLFDDVDAILVLNPDVVLAAGMLAPLLEAVQGPQRVGIAVPRLRDHTGRTSLSIRREPSILNAAGLRFLPHPSFDETVRSSDRYESPGPVAWATGAVMVISVTCFDQLSGFDASYFLYSEETDFCLRAADAGWSTMYLPDAVAVHQGAGSGFDIRLHGLQQVNRVRFYRGRHRRLKSSIYHALIVLAEISWIIRRRSSSPLALLMLVDPSGRLIPTAQKELP